MKFRTYFPATARENIAGVLTRNRVSFDFGSNHDELYVEVVAGRVQVRTNLVCFGHKRISCAAFYAPEPLYPKCHRQQSPWLKHLEGTY
jgi:hypothetical protein